MATRTKLQLKWFFQCNLWSLLNSRAPGGPVTFWWPMWGQRLPKLPKLPNVSKNVQSLKCSKPHFQGLANKGVCQSVVPASSGLFRPRGLAKPCPAFPSLLQLTPARPGPRSLAQLPRGPGRVPIIQGASQRSYRAQEPWQCPGMCPGGAHGHIYLQPIGTVPRLKNCIFTVSKNTWKNSKLNILFLLFDI